METSVTFFWHPQRHRGRGALPALLLVAGIGAGAAGPTQPLDTITAAATAAATDVARRRGHRAIEVTVQPLDRRLQLPACGEPLQTRPPGSAAGIGPMSIRVRCPSPSPWSIYVRATVRAMLELPVLTRTVPRGERIGASDLTLERRRIDRDPAALIRDRSRIIGLEARRDLPAGSALRHAFLAAPIIVERGQTVTLIAGNDGVEVRMQGKALGRAAAGDRLLVSNMRSGRSVEGVVEADGSVRIP